MTVQTQQSYVDYVGDGVTTQFVIPYPFLDLPSHIFVYDIDLGMAGKVLYVQGVAYSIIGIPGNPKVQFVTAPPAGKLIHIRRSLPITQLLDYLTTGVFPAESHESGLDKLTMLIQQLDAILNLGDVEFGDFMSKGPHPVLASTLSWQGDALELTSLLPGTLADSAVTLSQLNAAVTGGVPATLSGQTPLYFSGNAVTTTFTLSGLQDITAADINVYISGVKQSSHPVVGAYTVSNAGNPMSDTTMTFGVAPPTGTNNIEVIFPSGAVSVTVSAGSVNSAAIIDGSVGLAELAPGTLAGQFLIWNGSVWTLGIPTPLHISGFNAAVAALPVNVHAAATGSLNLGNQKIINLAAGVAPGDAVNNSQLGGLKRSQSGTVPASWWGSGQSVNLPWVPGKVTFTFPFGYGAAPAVGNAISVSVAFGVPGNFNWRLMHMAQDPDGAIDEERFVPVNISRTGNTIGFVGEGGLVQVGIGHYHITEA